MDCEPMSQVKNCCPICGYQFDEVEDINICPTGHEGWGNKFTKDELITEDDDYAWCI